MLANLLPIDKVSILALGKNIAKVEGVSSIADLASKYEIPLMSESRHRQELLAKIQAPLPESPKGQMPDYLKVLVSELIAQSGVMSQNTQRASYAPWFKSLIIKLKNTYDVKYKILSELLGMSAETLMGFAASLPKIEPAPIDQTSLTVADIWQQAPPKYKKTLDAFWWYLGKQHPNFQISYGQMRQTLINLGCYSPRGPKIKDHGGVKTPLHLHAIWEGDGKQINIWIHGKLHQFCWYAFVDQRVTLIVGSNLAKTESSENFLKALKNAKDGSGVYAMGILIDNRLADRDLSPIDEFLKEHRIRLIRTFPGNSKTNGMIENNFSIFEKYVGDIRITGSSDEEIAASVAENIIEVFTQQRNYQPRKRLGGASPASVATGAQRPEQQKSMIEILAGRLRREWLDVEQKWFLISDARQYFESLSLEAEEKMKRQLRYYGAATLIAAQASYIAKIKEGGGPYPSAYFMGIVRNKQQQILKNLYNEQYRASIEKLIAHFPPEYDETACADMVFSEIKTAAVCSTPAQALLHLEALSWSMVHYAASASLTKLWKKVQDLATRSFAISYQFWQQVNEYLSERIGIFLYAEQSELNQANQEPSEMVPKNSQKAADSPQSSV